MNLGKNPLLLIALLFVLLLVVSQAFSKRGSSKSLSEKELTQRTALAKVHVDAAERAFFEQNGTYTDSVTDLIGVDKRLKDDLADGVLISLDTGTGDKSFTAQINSRTLLYVFGRDASGRQTVSTCRKIRNSAKDYCTTDPVKPPKDDETGKLTTTTDSTTTESTSTTSK